MDEGMDKGTMYAIIILGSLVVIYLFFLFRNVLLWYYKINERVELLKENNFLLRKIAQGVGMKPEELIYVSDKKKK